VLNATDDHQNVLIYAVTLLSVVITALYMTRLFLRTFLFAPRDRDSAEHAHDAELVMTVPLLLLAALTLVGGFVVFDGVGDALGFPGGFSKFVFLDEAESFHFATDVAIISTALALSGIVVGWYFWSYEAKPAERAGEMFRPVYNLLANRYYIDNVYQFVIDRVVLMLGRAVAWFDRNVVNDTAVDGTGALGVLTGFGMKYLETGKLPNYALAITGGVIVLGALLLVLET